MNSDAFAVFPTIPAPSPRTLLDVLDDTVRAHPDAVAIDDGDTVLTYAELADEVTAARDRLRTAGIGVGDRVGVRVRAGTAEVYLAILAVLAAGAAYVPVDADDPDDRAERVWAEAGVCAVLGTGHTLATRTPAHGGKRRPTADDDAWIIFTSGTTGVPKGVAVSHRSAAAFADAEARWFARVGPGDRVLAGFSVAFDASCEEMWLAWRSGACLVPAPRTLVRSGAGLCPWLEERGVTVVSTVPTLAAQWPAGSLPGVRLLILGGEACPPELAARLLTDRREVWNTYGPTETTVVACGCRLVPGEVVRIGLPLDGWSLAVVGPDGVPVRWGETGELVIGGPGVARYLDVANEADRFAPLPALGWARAYRSGDVVRAEREGLVFVGRRDEQVKIRGHRVEPAAITAVLAEHAGVRQAYVRAVDEPSGTRLVAYVVGDVESAELRRHLARRLSSAMVPEVFVALPSMPVATSGKLDVRALPAPPAPRIAAATRDHASTTELVAAIWCEVLGVASVGLDDGFFDIGGHSLLAARVRDRLADALDRPVSAVALFAHPTVRRLAAHLDDPGESVATRERVVARKRPVRGRQRRAHPRN